jgi:hypothetical protein
LSEIIPILFRELIDWFHFQEPYSPKPQNQIKYDEVFKKDEAILENWQKQRVIENLLKEYPINTNAVKIKKIVEKSRDSDCKFDFVIYLLEWGFSQKYFFLLQISRSETQSSVRIISISRELNNGKN